MKLEPNTYFGQYRVIRLLGRGGMGEVHEVEHRTLGRRYALKLLPEDFTAQPEALGRFRREARVMANLEHPGIVRVDEFGETDGRYWLRMELVHGLQPELITLGDYAAVKGGRLEESEFSTILKQVLEALAYAHGKGVVHRDLKPGNILLEKDATGSLRVKISDFGLARVVGEELVRSLAQFSVSQSLNVSRAEKLNGGLSIGSEKTLRDEEGTSTRALLGTWEYMSPEQQRGEEADARSDVYAVGLMCYRLLTGKELGLKKPSQLVGGLKADWDPFIVRAVEQDAVARFTTGGQMLEAFGPVMQAVERDRQMREQREAEQRQRETEAARERAEEEALRARGEEWVIEEARAAKAWEAEEGRRQQEAQLLAAAATAPRKEGQFLSAGAGIKFACPHCLQHIEAERTMARRNTACPACKKHLIVPAPPSLMKRWWRRLAALPAAVPGVAWTPKLKPHAGSRFWRRILPWAALGIVVVGLAGIGGWHVWTELRKAGRADSAARVGEQGVKPPGGPAAKACLNNLRQLGLAFRAWGMDYDSRFPFNVARAMGGSAELARPGEDGFDDNSAYHFQVLSNALQSPTLLACPSDAKMPAMDFRQLRPENVSYRIRSGGAVSVGQADEVLLYCPIHKHVVMCDGSVHDANSETAAKALRQQAAGAGRQGAPGSKAGTPEKAFR